MALTQQQWYDKIKASMPAWFFQEVENQEALLQGIAKMFSQLEADIEDHVAETFIGTSSGNFLDTHGSERSISRIESETDSEFRIRVQNLANQSNKVDLKEVVDLLLDVGECTILEDESDMIFCDRENFLNRDEVLFDRIQWAFSVLVEAQGDDHIYDLIIEMVNNAKALGVLWRLIELEA